MNNATLRILFLLTAFKSAWTARAAGQRLHRAALEEHQVLRGLSESLRLGVRRQNRSGEVFGLLQQPPATSIS